MDRKSKLLVLGGLVCAIASMSGCGLVNKLRAKNSLNEGVREFNKGQFDAAQKRFEDALDMSPDNTDAQLYYARALDARFQQKQTEDFGLKTIEAYQNIVKRNAANYKTVDTALAFEGKVYETLAGVDLAKAEEYKQAGREALLKRADLPSADAQTKATVFYTIGEGYWQEAYNISHRYDRVTAGKLDPQAVPATEQEKMKPLILKAHEYLQKALSVKADYADAWIYEKLTYIQDVRIESNAGRKKELLAKIDECQANYKKYHEQQAAAQTAAAQ